MRSMRFRAQDPPGRSAERAVATAVVEARETRGRSRLCVVGYDGSTASRGALLYAAHRVAPAGRLIVAYSVPPTFAVVETGYYTGPVPDPREHGRKLLRELRRDQLLGVQFRTELLDGPPASCLAGVAESAGADEIVIGCHGRGRVRSLLGSTSHRLIHEAHMPVVVVPQRAIEPATGAAQRGHPPRTRLRTAVVGYDRSEASLAAVTHAAARVGPEGRIVAVHAYHAHQSHGRALLRELETAKDDGPAVETVLVEGRPSKALTAVAASHDAEEIVVGSRGHGPFRAVLGSTSHELLHDAERPVTIVPQ